MKALRFKINKLENQNLEFISGTVDSLYSYFHYHEEIQITWIEQGRGSVLIGNEISKFDKGDILLIGSNVPHLIRYSNQGFKTRNLYFKSVLFETETMFSNEMEEIGFFLNEWKRGLIIKEKQAKKLHRLFEKHTEQLDGFDRLLLLFRIINVIRHLPIKNWMNNNSNHEILKEEAGQRLNKVFEFSFENLHRPIAIHEVAAVAHLSVSQFSIVFKKHTGKTYIQFLNQLRIEEVCQQLTYTDLQIAEIVDQSGFSNLSNFNKTFKNIKGLSPSLYRNRMVNFPMS